MARIYQSGFEFSVQSNRTEWNFFTGSVSIVSTIVRSGNYSMRANPSSATGYFSTSTSDTAQKSRFFRFYIYIASAPSTDTVILHEMATKGTNKAGIKLTTTRTVQLWNLEDSTQVGSDSSALAVDTWYRIEMNCDDTTLSSTYLEAKIDGTTFASGTVNLVGVTDAHSVGPSTTTTTDLYFDDFAYNDGTGSFQNSWPGEGKIVHLMPNAAGNSAQWTRGGSDSGANWSQVDEVSPNDATDYNHSTTLDQEDLFNIDSQAISTFYFDASDAAATDPNSVWTNDANAYDGNTATYATTNTVGSESSNFLKAEGTSAPDPGGTITQVRVREYRNDETAGGSITAVTKIYTDSLGETLGTITSNLTQGTYTAYTTLTEPAGGWSWAKVQALESKSYISAVSGVTERLARIEIEVTSSIPSSATINVVSVLGRVRADAAGNNAGFKFEIEASSGGTIEQGAEIIRSDTIWTTPGAYPTGVGLPLVLYDLPGASTTPWTKADLDTAQIGYKLTTDNTNSVQISTLWLSVDFTEATSLSVDYSTATNPGPKILP